jgi:3-oxoacyl-[acyl-carrier protein] reductase
MNLDLKGRLFLVCGSTSGFGRSVTTGLVSEGAEVIAIARGESALTDLLKTNPNQIEIIAGDITKPEVTNIIIDKIGKRHFDGVFVNAGGPPAKTFLETDLDDWDSAYKTLLRWKFDLVKKLLPALLSRKYGRILFCESISVKQPIAALVLSNALRLAVVGMAKTLSEEVADKNITVNVLAPGYHDTTAMNRLIEKKSRDAGLSKNEARNEFEKEIKSGKMGDPGDFASLAVWLLSPGSRYVTGQTISIDGGLNRSVFG